VLGPLIAAALVPTPIDLDGISIERASALHGRVVVASFVVAKPSYTWPDRKGGTITVIGAADKDDGAERGAVLKGKRLDVEEGKRVVLVGVLRVIRHVAAVVGGVVVPAWTEIRVEQVAP